MFEYYVSIDYSVLWACGFSVSWLFQDFKQSVKYNEYKTHKLSHRLMILITLPPYWPIQYPPSKVYTV